MKDTNLPIRQFMQTDDATGINVASQAIENLTIEELNSYLADLRNQLAELECNEPDGNDCEEYDDWDEQMAELEALIFDIEDRLDELRD